MYFNEYPPKNTKTITIEKISAAVEKFAGKIKIITAPTGIQSSIKLSLNVIVLSFIFAKYLATYTINTTEAKVDV